jgi:hypothetical protein
MEAAWRNGKGNKTKEESRTIKGKEMRREVKTLNIYFFSFQHILLYGCFENPRTYFPSWSWSFYAGNAGKYVEDGEGTIDRQTAWTTTSHSFFFYNECTKNFQLTMTTRLLKRVLQQTAAELEEQEQERDTVSPLEPKAKRKQKKKKQRQLTTTNGKHEQRGSIVVPQETLINESVRSILAFDRRLNKNKAVKNYKALALNRIETTAKKKSKAVLKSKDMILGDTRSSSSALSPHKRSVPSFNKHTYKKQQEEKKIQSIAKALRRSQKSNSNKK